ncbi:MAG: YkvA family protein [Gammaproteobacteria bacterium]|jgi:uncharacterized membrane protein YkvA (DUF1232 family)
MSLRISIELSARDLKHMRDAMKKARRTVRDAEDSDILDAARTLLQEVQSRRVPNYVRERIDRLQAMINIMEDEEWPLTRGERERLLAVLVYFSDPEDIIPDDIPGIGLLDDAIMIELAFRDLRHEIEAYQDFCEFRHKYDSGFRLLRDPARREKKLGTRRDQLRERIARRREKEPAPVL